MDLGHARIVRVDIVAAGAADADHLHGEAGFLERLARGHDLFVRRHFPGFAILEPHGVLVVAAISLQPDEFEPLLLRNQLRERDHFLGRPEPRPVLADIDVDGDLQFPPGCQRRCRQIHGILLVVDDRLDIGRHREETHQTRNLQRSDDRPVACDGRCI